MNDAMNQLHKDEGNYYRMCVNNPLSEAVLAGFVTTDTNTKVCFL